jgi:hypothetical protein
LSAQRYSDGYILALNEASLTQALAKARQGHITVTARPNIEESDYGQRLPLRSRPRAATSPPRRSQIGR